MRRFVATTLVISGTVFSLFVVNLIMFAYVPAYHNALEKAVWGKERIPVVIKAEDSIEIVNETERSEVTEAFFDEKEEAVPLVPTVQARDIGNNTEDTPAIIDKEYHEDCGTGKGYWVIKYEDGSVGIE